MRTQKIILTLILITAIAAGTMAGCGNGESTDQAGAEKSQQITVALDWTPNTNHTGMYVALDQGYYEEAGLSVNLVQPPESGALAMAASGKAEFAVTFQEEIGAALTSDTPLPVVAVASIVEHNDSGLISLKEKGIDSPKKMEGHNYASWDTPIEHAILSHIIRKDGGDPEKVNFVPNTVTDVVSALQTDTDLIWVYYSWDGIACQLAGLNTNYIEFRKMDPVLDFYTPVLASGTDWLEKNPDIAKVFLAATQKGYEYAIEHPEESAQILLAHAPELSPELVQASQAYLSDKYKAEKKEWGSIDEARWTAFYDWMYQNKLIQKELGSTGFTNEYLPQ